MNHFLKSEKKKLREIRGVQEKLLYIWDYYKLWIIGILAAIVVAIYLLSRLNAARADYDFYLILANTMEDVGTGSRFWNGYMEYAGLDQQESNVVFNNEIYFDFTLNTTGNTYFDSFIVFAEAGTLDAITMRADSLVELGQTGRLMDLDSEAAASLREHYGDRFLYLEGEDEEGNPVRYPVGIDISDSILMTDTQLYADSCALGLGYKSQHADAVEKFLEYVLGAGN